MGELYAEILTKDPQRMELISRCKTGEFLTLKRFHDEKRSNKDAIQVRRLTGEPLGHLSQNIVCEIIPVVDQQLPIKVVMCKKGPSRKVTIVYGPTVEGKPLKPSSVVTVPFCQTCGSPTLPKRRAKHSQLTAVGLFLAGIAISCTGVGLIIGVPMIFVGLYLGAVVEKTWHCPRCGTAMPRF